MPVLYTEKNPCSILFHIRGSVWLEVIPFCILNLLITLLVEELERYGIKIGFSPQGHGLMGLLVSFLVINKSYLALDRYMQARTSLGHAFASLRELHQLALTFTEGQEDKVAKEWRNTFRKKTVDLLDCTLSVLKDEKKAAFLSCYEYSESYDSCDDPLHHVHLLRSHVFNNSKQLNSQLELLERCKFVDMLNCFSVAYRDLLKLAATPLPFPMIQMGRTFLFLWIFTMPLALAGLNMELLPVEIFVFFLTYGYCGLEMVAMKMLHPFGDDINDLDATGMRHATVLGIDSDCLLVNGEINPSVIKPTNLSSRTKAVDDQYHIISTNQSHEVTSGFLHA